MTVKLITDPAALEHDAKVLDDTAKECRDEGDGDTAAALASMAGRLRSAARMIRDGKIKGVPVR